MQVKSYKEKRLRNEIEDISSDLYNLHDRDEELRYYNLKTYRDEIFRSFVMYLHLSMEDLLEDLLIRKLRKNKVFKIKTTKKFIRERMHSSEIIDWSARFGIIKKSEYAKLKLLNQIRNDFAHTWLLNVRKTTKVGGRAKKWRKIPRIAFENKNLLNKEIFLNRFIPQYSKIYLRLLFKVWRLKRH